MYIFSILAFSMIGAAAGFIGGLFGIGGGIIAVPSLLLVFSLIGFPEQNRIQLAIGTSLAAMIFTAGSSAWSHFKQNGLHWDLLRILVPAVTLGSIFGAFIAHDLKSHQLKILFSIIVIVTGIYTLLTANKKKSVIQLQLLIFFPYPF